MKKEDAAKYNYEWMDKVIDLHRQYGIKSVDLSQLRQINEKDAIKAAEYVYEDIVANADIEPSYKDILSNLQVLDEEDRVKAVGVLFESIETCGKECTTSSVRIISRKWNVNEGKIDEVLRAVFVTM